ncbi:MAG: N-acetyl-gamma-glutamyl-phosphate reductase [Lachnospiraceae bacterium]|nr:N-acetyl-gamma-glutamyl-phosphate reductase [Lachnospiraceae bacterium]
MIKAGIVGATGYAGNELVRLLLGHKEVELSFLVSRSYAGQPYASIYKNFMKFVDMDCVGDELPGLLSEVDVVFTATPQGYLAGILTEQMLEKARFIDLSADYRLKDVEIYEKWYGIKHGSPNFLPEAVYGLPEMNRNGIKDTRLLANPGCYTTCSILTAYPLVKEHLIDPNTLIINALSGVSGAGRGAKVQNLYCEVNESAKAYGVATHRHTPEIEEQLSYAFGSPVVINFTPHLVPMNRGILVTETASLNEGVTQEDIKAAYTKYYGNEFFIRLLDGGCPETRCVEGSNFVDIGFRMDERTGRVILMGALDNLVKGAAGQAVQNMNIMFGFRENEGLMTLPMLP